MDKRTSCVAVVALLLLIGGVVSPVAAQSAANNSTNNSTGGSFLDSLNITPANGSTDVTDEVLNGTNGSGNSSSANGGCEVTVGGVTTTTNNSSLCNNVNGSADDFGGAGDSVGGRGENGFGNGNVLETIFTSLLEGLTTVISGTVLFVARLVAGRGVGTEDYNFFMPPGSAVGNMMHAYMWSMVAVSLAFYFIIISINSIRNSITVTPPRMSAGNNAEYSGQKLIRILLSWPYRYGIFWLGSILALALLPSQETISASAEQAFANVGGIIIAGVIVFNLPGLIMGLMVFFHVGAYLAAIALTIAAPIFETLSVPFGWGQWMVGLSKRLTSIHFTTSFFAVPFAFVLNIGYSFVDVIFEQLGDFAFLGITPAAIMYPTIWFAALLSSVALFFVSGAERRFFGAVAGTLGAISVADKFRGSGSSTGSSSAAAVAPSGNGPSPPDESMSPSSSFMNGNSGRYQSYSERELIGNGKKPEKPTPGLPPGASAGASSLGPGETRPATISESESSVERYTGPNGIGGLPTVSSGEPERETSDPRALGEGVGPSPSSSSTAGSSTSSSTSSTPGSSTNTPRRSHPDITTIESREDLDEDGRYVIGEMEDDGNLTRQANNPRGFSREFVFEGRSGESSTKSGYERFGSSQFNPDKVYIQDVETDEVYDIRPAIEKEKFNDPQNSTASRDIKRNRDKFDNY